MEQAANKLGVVLMNLGSPDSTEVQDVKRYLTEFLMDERVLDTPKLWRWLLVKGIIVPFRSPRSAAAYKTVWMEEGSPLMVITEQFRQAFKAHTGLPTETAMRYGNPHPKEAFDKLLEQHPDLEEVVLVPLYPHYAMSSYETAVEYAMETYKKGNYPFKVSTIRPFYNEPSYINALAKSIAPYLEQNFDHLLFSYHGLPERHIRKSDVTGHHCLQSADCCTTDSAAHAHCYRHQCFTTTQLVAKQLGLRPEQYSSSFQSRLGRDEWLKPYTVVRLDEMPKEGIKKLLVVCPAFVSDCLETLEEMGLEGKEEFLHAGGTSFEAIPCLNVHPLWVEALASWVEAIAEGQREMVVA